MSKRPDATPSSAPTVAVIDDDAAALESFGALLESEGFAPVLFASCEQFIAEATRPEQIGCLVLDARLPGMSGLELLEQMHRVGDQIPTVFIMGRFDATARARAMRFPSVVRVLDKPVAAQELFGAIRAALES